MCMQCCHLVKGGGCISVHDWNIFRRYLRPVLSGEPGRGDFISSVPFPRLWNVVCYMDVSIKTSKRSKPHLHQNLGLG